MTDSPRHFPIPTGLTTLAAALLLVLATACGGGDAEAPDTTASDTAATTEGTATASDVQTYEVRGQVTALPDEADPTSNLTLRHEAIDEFVSMNGEVVGMSSMSMPFPVAEDLSLEGVEVGDKVRFDLVVDWQGDPAYQVTRLEKLPDDTELEFRKKQPVGGENMDQDDMGSEGMEAEDA